MHKGQDAAVFSRAGYFALVIFSLFLILNTAACSSPTDQIITDNSSITSTPGKQTSTTQIVTPISEKTAPAPAVTPTEDCLVAGGEVQSSRFESELLGRSFEYMIYLPPCYQIHQQENYPSAYLLHGLSYTNDQWLRIGLVESMDRMIAESLISPFIIVLPFEARPDPPQTSRFPEVLTQDLIPWVDDHYRTLPDNHHRAIGGVSRGAAWAIKIGFEHRDYFSAIGAHSLPLFQADHANITTWVSQEPIEEQPRVFIDIGRNDQEWNTAQDFADLLDTYHIPHEWYLFDNGHTESYWASHLEQYLRWYARDW